MAELIIEGDNELVRQVQEFTPTLTATFTVQPSNNGNSLIQQDKLTSVQIASKKVLITKGNDMQ